MNASTHRQAADQQQNPSSGPGVHSSLKVARILVPVDFSECSKKALQYAIPMARQHQAVLILLSVVEAAYGGGEMAVVDYIQLEAVMKEAAEKQLSEFVGKEIPSDISTQSIVRTGPPSREITELAKSLQVDLIVISTHGRTGLKHVFLGSVTEHVVQRAPCPVFVVREREHEILVS